MTKRLVAMTLVALAAGLAAAQQMNWKWGREGVLVTTNEQDLAALRAWHYGSSDIVESPTNWFGFNPATGTITNFHYESGRENVVLPWQIGGVAVTAVGNNAFTSPLTNVSAPRSLVTIGEGAFSSCGNLASVSLPAVRTIEEWAFASCGSLESVQVPASTIGASAFASCVALSSIRLTADAPTVGEDAIPDGCTVYVTDPTATGYGATLDGNPVVRLPLFSDAVRARSWMMFDAGGFAGGEDAATVSGAGVGTRAHAIDGGAAGDRAVTTSGAAVGAQAESTIGGAVGAGAVAGAGFAGGASAITCDDWGPIDAVQLGTGMNPDAGTLQVYKYKLMDESGVIPAARIPAPAPLALAGITGAVTVTNLYERMVTVTGTGAVEVAWADLREPLPVYTVLGGFSSVAFPAGTQIVGGGSWQTNRLNHFAVWRVGTNLFVNPITTSPME